jgi:hypothetical protein
MVGAEVAELARAMLAALLARCQAEDEATELPAGLYDVEVVSTTVRGRELIFVFRVLSGPQAGRRAVGQLPLPPSPTTAMAEKPPDPVLDTLWFAAYSCPETLPAALLGRRFRAAVSIECGGSRQAPAPGRTSIKLM